MRSRFRTALNVTALLIFPRISGLGSLYSVLRFERLNLSPLLYKNQLAKLPFKHLARWVASGIGKRNCSSWGSVLSVLSCMSLSIACLLLSLQSADQTKTNNFTHGVPELRQ